MSGYIVKEVLRNKVIFSQGSRAETAYILKRGAVGISIKVGSEEKELSRLDPTTVFGEMALLLNDHRRTATATALEDCEVIEISRQAFEAYMDCLPAVMASILKAFADRLLATTKSAVRTPDLFLGVCEILHLFGNGNGTDLSYGHTVQAFSRAFLVDPGQIETLLEIISSANLIELKKEEGRGRRFSVPKDEDFLKRANTVYKGFRSIS